MKKINKARSVLGNICSMLFIRNMVISIDVKIITLSLTSRDNVNVVNIITH